MRLLLLSPLDLLQIHPRSFLITAKLTALKYSGASVGSGAGQYLMDTETYPSTLPTSEAKAIDALFNPPATLDNYIVKYYVVPCNATAPEVGISIGGRTFYPDDLFITGTEFDSICFSAIQTCKLWLPSMR